MKQIQIIQYMAQVVEAYIYRMKGQEVQINLFAIINDQRQLNMLIDAYNHVTK